MKEGTKMVRTTVKVSGMACSMCEAHINDAIRAAFPVEKVSSSHSRGGDGDPISRATGRKHSARRHRCHRLHGGRDQHRALRKGRLFPFREEATLSAFRCRYFGCRFGIILRYEAVRMERAHRNPKFAHKMCGYRKSRSFFVISIDFSTGYCHNNSEGAE